MDTDPLDQALTVFAGTAPEYGSEGLSNHGPMAAEALMRLGQADVVPGWAANYAQRLEPAPAPAPRPLSDEAWPKALGDQAAFPDWLTLFETEMADRPVKAVIGEWVPRLVPGAVGAATHGLIRTAHGVRALGDADTPARRVELAHGLAYWASVYQELPGPPLFIGHQDVAQALADLPYLPEESPETFLISERVKFVAEIADEFEQGVASLAPRGAVTLLDALAGGGARAYLRNAEDGVPIALLHSATAPLALELILPWLAEEDRDAAMGYGWQAVAALHVAYAIDRASPIDESGPVPSAEDLIAAAVASGDEHAIKLTEAALRCHARTDDPDLLRAAADASARFRD